MKIVQKNIDGDQCISIQEVYCNTVLETSEGNKIAICMRDDTIEFNVLDHNKWYRVDMQTGTVNAMD